MHLISAYHLRHSVPFRFHIAALHSTWSTKAQTPQEKGITNNTTLNYIICSRKILQNHRVDSVDTEEQVPHISKPFCPSASRHWLRFFHVSIIDRHRSYYSAPKTHVLRQHLHDEVVPMNSCSLVKIFTGTWESPTSPIIMMPGLS